MTSSTDIALLVSTPSEEEIGKWDRQRIIKSLKIETWLVEDTINEIADEVEQRLLESKLEVVTTYQIREIIDSVLLDKGLIKSLDRHALLSIPLINVHNILFDANKENSNTTYNPESINLTLAELITKQYMLSNVFSNNVAMAHLNGTIHCHDVGLGIRPYCGGHSLEYIKKYGLDLPSITSASKPAKHPDVLVGHMVKFASVLQSNYAGAVGFEAVNMFFAPLLKGRTKEEIKQTAQMLIFEFNQLAGARGGQVVFSDFNLYYGIPERFRDTPAVGPGGKYMVADVDTGEIIRRVDKPKIEQSNKEKLLTYSDFEKESNEFITALFETYLEGDSHQKTFFFPKPLLHIDKSSIKSEGWNEFFELACKVASKQGITYFVFDRGDKVSVSQCCRLKLELDSEDLKLVKQPEKLRFTALQNVSINLPRLAYEAKGNNDILWKKLDEALELACQAHVQKKKFLKKLFNEGKEGPYAFFHLDKDGESYLKWNKLTFLIGIIGLDDMVHYHLGKQLHESKASFDFGLKFIEQMKAMVDFKASKYKLKLVLEETPAESSGYRLATLDLQNYNGQASSIVKGNIKTGEYYYENSIHYAQGADVDYIKRIKDQSKFHKFIDGGAIIHVWLGEYEPSAKSIMNLVMKTYEKTDCQQIAFSPEFTVCQECNKTSRGLKKKCPSCKSEDVYGITRVVGYFSKISNWNEGKKNELSNRRRENIR